MWSCSRISILGTIFVLWTMLMSCQCFPISSEESMEVNNKENDSAIVGADLDNLISDMFNRIIQKRLENLLQGVSNNRRNQLLESSESLFNIEDFNTNSAFEEGEDLVDISSVTEIPREQFTGLPGSSGLFFGYWIF